ncbi:MAG: hypothetical protein EOM37_08310 [Proteobacteria bacterium]|nr:hypothetical protein [Pseudomonadota bacterium]
MAGSNEDPTTTFLLVLGVFGLLGYAVWYFFRIEILTAIQYIRLVELAPLALFSDHVQYCVSWLKNASVTSEVPSDDVIMATRGCFGASRVASMPVIDAMNYYTVTPKSLGEIGRLLGSFVRWPLVIACCGVAYFALYKSKRNGFRVKYDLESFIKIQGLVWPIIAPIVKFNPAKASSRVPGQLVPAKLPTFAEALSPEEWLAMHVIPVNKNVPQKEAVHAAFLKQLGPRWTGIDDLPPYMRALFAAFALKGAQKRDESDEFLGRIATCWSPKGGFRMTPPIAAEVKKILKDPEIGGKALEVASKHAYRTTAMLGVLKWARFMGGVLASASFLWLRGVDRDLWYAANNLGRRSFHTEGAGALAHFMAEDLAGKPLMVPRLETAIISINKYMGENAVQIPPSENVQQKEAV